jgi:hypothetical protein
MKKIMAIFVTMLFVTSLYFAVVGCKKAAEETAPAPKVQAPVAQPAPAATATPAPAATATPEQSQKAESPSQKNPRKQLSSCYEQAKAKALMGDERKKFMTDCIRAIRHK